ncbi:MAG: hypothetical protein HYV27_02965 [Candidatus Hydrogenedentes bacterium]|nr:hypothetical protein [Candidatus Hydrogenedentota bacterium]
MNTPGRSTVLVYVLLLGVYFSGNALIMQRFAIVEECAGILRDTSVTTLPYLEKSLGHLIREKIPVRASGAHPGMEEVMLKLRRFSSLHVTVVYAPETQLIQECGLVHAGSDPVDLDTGEGAGRRLFGDWLAVPSSLLWLLLWPGVVHRDTQFAKWPQKIRYLPLGMLAILALVPLLLADVVLFLDVILSGLDL